MLVFAAKSEGGGSFGAKPVGDDPQLTSHSLAMPGVHTAGELVRLGRPACSDLDPAANFYYARPPIKSDFSLAVALEVKSLFANTTGPLLGIKVDAVGNSSFFGPIDLSPHMRTLVTNIKQFF